MPSASAPDPRMLDDVPGGGARRARFVRVDKRARRAHRGWSGAGVDVAGAVDRPSLVPAQDPWPRHANADHIAPACLARRDRRSPLHAPPSSTRTSAVVAGNSAPRPSAQLGLARPSVVAVICRRCVDRLAEQELDASGPTRSGSRPTAEAQPSVETQRSAVVASARRKTTASADTRALDVRDQRGRPPRPAGAALTASKATKPPSRTPSCTTTTPSDRAARAGARAARLAVAGRHPRQPAAAAAAAR